MVNSEYVNNQKSEWALKPIDRDFDDIYDSEGKLVSLLIDSGISKRTARRKIKKQSQKLSLGSYKQK